MPRFILKGNKEEDFYIEWTTVADGPADWGTAEDLALTPERKEKADRLGSTAFKGEGAWDDTGTLMIRDLGSRHVDWKIKRENIADFVKEWEKAKTIESQDMVIEKYCTVLVVEECDE